MTKLFYIKSDDFICDVTDRYDHAKQLIKEYQKDWKGLKVKGDTEIENNFLKLIDEAKNKWIVKE